MAARRPENEANLRRHRVLDRLGESEGPDSSEGHEDNSGAFFGEAPNHRNGAVELLNSFGDSPFRRAVAGMVLKLRNDRNVRIVPQTPEQFESALRRYKQAADKSWSLTDCASFQVMEAEQIQAALTHDQHFTQAGFETLLR